MRTIKFRGKDIETGEWVYGFYVRFEDCFRKTIDGKERISHRIYTGFADSCASKDGYDFSGDWHEVDPDTIGQFNGFYDSKGNEIFEGDIIADAVSAMYVSTFERGCFDFSDESGRAIANPIAGICTVIGNIWDNPGLMKRGGK